MNSPPLLRRRCFAGSEELCASDNNHRLLYAWQSPKCADPLGGICGRRICERSCTSESCKIDETVFLADTGNGSHSAELVGIHTSNVSRYLLSHISPYSRISTQATASQGY